MINDLLNGIQNMLGYRRAEAIGFLFLFVLMVFVIALPFFTGILLGENAVVPENDKKLLDSLVAIMEQEGDAEYFAFDPNTLSVDSMGLLGLSSSVVKTWQNYRKSGGTFQEKADFKKIYGLSAGDYRALEPFIRLREKTVRKERSNHHSPSTTTQEAIDINEASAGDLLFIKGIGPKLSERIIKYRDLLGGYVHEDQLNNVYYLEGEALRNLKEQVFIAQGFQPEKINLNESSYKGVIKHPYIDKEIADGIFSVRNSEDSVVTYQKLKDLMSGQDSLFLVLLPYVDF